MTQHRQYDFFRWRVPALLLSLAVIGAGLVAIASKGLNFGVEFEGGTAVLLRFADPPSLTNVRTVLTGALGQDIVLYPYGDTESRQLMARVPVHRTTDADSGTGSAVRAVESALTHEYAGAFEVLRSEYIGPAVGRELQTRGVSATLMSLGGILAYLTMRYRFSFAVGAVVATLHDLMVAVSFLAFFDHDITLNVVAALLTVAGYSSNDTIVVFDRVREHLRQARAPSLAGVMNLAINQTLSRTVITAGTTLLSVLALYLFGGEALRGFAFTLLVGIVSGTYSTVFIAGSAAIAGRARSRGNEAVGQ